MVNAPRPAPNTAISLAHLETSHERAGDHPRPASFYAAPAPRRCVMSWADGTPKWTRHAPVLFTCVICGRTKMLPPSIVKTRRYCSIACRSAAERVTAIDRFWANVDKSEDCWFWLGGRDRDGYGEACFDGKKIRAHRLSWTLEFGDRPGNLGVLHKCDTPPCVRPSHLFLGNNADNVRDRIAKGRPWR